MIIESHLRYVGVDVFVFTPPLEEVFVLNIFIVRMKVARKFIEGAKFYRAEGR
jgi:hypothetical protein